VKKIAYNDWFILIKIRVKPNDIVLIQVYFPKLNAEDNSVEEIYSSLDELCKIAKENNLIVMGDWNAIVEGQEAGAFELETRNERGGRLVDFCRQHDMIIANTFQNIHCRQRYT
jgi:exonuclease III